MQDVMIFKKIVMDGHTGRQEGVSSPGGQQKKVHRVVHQAQI